MKFSWGRLLIKKDFSKARHIYGLVSVITSVHEREYIFWGKEGCPVYFRRHFGDYINGYRVSAEVSHKKKDGYTEFTFNQLKTKWNWVDLEKECEKHMLFDILKTR